MGLSRDVRTNARGRDSFRAVRSFPAQLQNPVYGPQPKIRPGPIYYVLALGLPASPLTRALFHSTVTPFSISHLIWVCYNKAGS